MKSTQINIRLSERENKKLSDKSKKYGVAKSKIIRQYINDNPVIDKNLMNKLDELVVAINRVGNNINQIAKKANEVGVSKNDLLSVKVYQREIVNSMREVIEHCNNKNSSHEAG